MDAQSPKSPDEVAVAELMACVATMKRTGTPFAVVFLAKRLRVMVGESPGSEVLLATSAFADVAVKVGCSPGNRRLFRELDHRDHALKLAMVRHHLLRAGSG